MNTLVGESESLHALCPSSPSPQWFTPLFEVVEQKSGL